MIENNPLKPEVLCCRGRCCPTFTQSGQSIIITDDYSGQVKLTIDEFQKALEKYNEIKKHILMAQ